MHRHFPANKVSLLEENFLRRMRTDLYKWSYQVGAKDLGLTETFYVDYLIIIRIHFPFAIARKAKNVVAPRLPFSEKVRLMSAAMRNWRLLANMVERRISSRFAKRGKSETDDFDADAYHQGLPMPALSHGPHLDTWYGHSYDGLNLWWSIDGVDEDNTIILYPDLFGQELPFDPKNMYIAPGIQLPKPLKMVPRPGELFVFNPEILHGTQVNISDSTRVVVSTRLNPETPRFDANAPFHFEHWFSSKDLERNKLSKLCVFSKKQYPGSRRATKPKEPFKKSPKPVPVPERLSVGQAVSVCDSSALAPGATITVDLDNARLILYRGAEGVRAFSRVCPHLGMDLGDGCHEGAHAFCPGHGIEFSLEDGSSRCEDFELRQYRATEKEGQIYVQTMNGKGD